MKQLRAITLYAALCICFLNLSCKKEKENPATQSSCRLITALGGPDTYHFTYNSEGKISSLLYVPTNVKATYTYEGNTTTVLWESKGNFTSKSIITSNSLGFATNIRMEMNKTGTVWQNQSIEYNGTQLAKILYTSSDPNAKVAAVKYTWKEGNLATMESGTSIITFDYYIDRPSAPGDWRKFVELQGGYRLYDNKNLTKSMKKGADITTFKYDFDTSGKIIKQTVIEPENVETFVQFEYACN